MKSNSSNGPKYLGCHVSAAGGYEKALAHAEALGINTIQIHPTPPQRWNSKAVAAGAEDEYLALRKKSAVERVFFHGIYLVNLANPDTQQFHLSKMSVLFDLELQVRMLADGVIIHTGSNNKQPVEAEGFKQSAKGINWILENAPKEARLILEVAAGGGSVIGDRIEELAEIYSQVKDQSRVGFGLDTQHMWASGYNWQDNFEEIIDQIKSVFTLEKVWAVHLNDSKTECSSRKDRHENLGEGLIGKDALLKLLLHPDFVDIPFILETPAMKDHESAKAEVEKLRGWLS